MGELFTPYLYLYYGSQFMRAEKNGLREEGRCGWKLAGANEDLVIHAQAGEAKAWQRLLAEIYPEALRKPEPCCVIATWPKMRYRMLCSKSICISAP